ncbi:hypothetical protein Avbf_16684, partial [Armadillidium vulgare]
MRSHSLALNVKFMVMRAYYACIVVIYQFYTPTQLNYRNSKPENNSSRLQIIIRR